MPTKRQLHATVERLLAACKSWRDMEGPVIPQRGRNRKSISQLLCQAIEQLVELCNSDDFQSDCWRTVLAVDRLASQWARWLTEWEAAPDVVDPSGTANLWSAVDQVARSIAPPRPVKLESPRVLAALPGMTHRQIAKIYDWWTPVGQPNTAKVEEELKNPGAIVKPGSKSPEEKRCAAELDAEWRSRLKR